MNQLKPFDTSDLSFFGLNAPSAMDYDYNYAYDGSSDFFGFEFATTNDVPPPPPMAYGNHGSYFT